MALTIAVAHKERLSTHNLVMADITFDNSYTTNGVALAPKDLGLVLITAVFCEGGPITPQYDRVNNKLKAFRYDGSSAGQANFVEVANTTDLSAITVRCLFYGHGN